MATLKSRESSPECMLIDAQDNFDVKEFYRKWSEQNLDELILKNDFIYKDPLINKLRPHEGYVYTLGLNLALEYACEYYEKETKRVKETPSGTDLALSIGIDNEKEFLENIDENSKRIKLSNKAFKEILSCNHTCPRCDYKSELNMIIDQHLTQPHNSPNNYFCNFCMKIISNQRQEYQKHLFIDHGRLFIYERPSYSYQCSNCDFECREKFRFWKHSQNCIENQNESQKQPLLEPTKSDLNDYNYLFGINIEQNHSSNRFIKIVSKLGQEIQYNNLPESQTSALINTSVNHSTIVLPTNIKTSLINKPQNMLNNNKINELLKKRDVKTSINEQPMPKKQIITIKKPPINQNNPVIVFPKYLICPICNGFLRNLVDLTSHIQKIHKLDERSTNTVINQKVIPQLNKLSDLTKKTSTINGSGNNKTLIKVVSKVQLNNSPQEKVVNLENVSTVLVKPKPYLEELKEVCSYLKLSQQEFESKFVEVKTVTGKCYRCSNKTYHDLIKHFKDNHFNSSNCLTKFNCILCGINFTNREKLIQHLLNVHSIVILASSNRMFTLPKQQQQQQSQIEYKSSLVSQTIKSESPSKSQKDYKCIECDQKFNDFFNYCTHLIKEHQDKSSIKQAKPDSNKNIKKIKCLVCKNYFSNDKTYQNHVKTHVKDCKVMLINLNPIQKSSKKFKSEYKRLTEVLLNKIGKKINNSKTHVDDDVIILE